MLVPALILFTLPLPVRAQVLTPGEMREPVRPTGTTPTPMSVGLPPETEVQQQERPVAPASIAPAPIALEGPIDPDQYICGRGDIFELNFWGRQNFRVRFAVDLEGRAFIAKVGYVPILGKTLRQARTAVKEAVGRYFPKVDFDIALLEPRTFLVHVVENIPRPGIYTARAVDRASAVIARAGGIVGKASRRRIVVQHHDGSTSAVDLVRYELTGDVRFNPPLLDGDVIKVPFEELGATVGGAVRRPGHYELIESQDLRELIELAGGLATTATRQLPIRLVRADEREIQTQSVVPYPKEGLPQLPLRAEDHVDVPSVSELQRSVLVIGAVSGAVATDEATQLRRLEFVENDTVRTLLERAGGVVAGADLTGSYIVREGKQVPVDLEALLVRRDFTVDRPLRVGDNLVVPYKRRAVSVAGAVFHPSAYPFNPQFNVLDYVAAAGGETRNAQGLETLKVIRTTGETLPISKELKVAPGDTIIVPERDFSRPEMVQLAMGFVGLVLSGAALFIAARR
jgi:protein involved in polysaccharide export with SLBB domain